MPKKLKIKKPESKKPTCPKCNNDKLIAIYQRIFVSAQGVMLGNFTPEHLWYCHKCSSEIKIQKEDQELWRETFVDQEFTKGL